MTFFARVLSSWATWREASAPSSTPTESAAFERNGGYLTVRDVAALFKVHPETIRRLTRDRLLTGHSIGGQWRYKLEEVEADAERWGEHRRVFYRRKTPDHRRDASYKRRCKRK